MHIILAIIATFIAIGALIMHATLLIMAFLAVGWFIVLVHLWDMGVWYAAAWVGFSLLCAAFAARGNEGENEK